MTEPERPRRPWRDVAATFLRLGVTSYGGPAIMGIMQAELQEKRAWVSRERFLEGLSLVNMLPGATVTQLAIFIGYARGGWWGGLLAGACFVLPGFIVILGLTIAYAGLGVIPVVRGALYGLGPVVLAIFAVAVYRLGLTAARTTPQAVICLLALVTAVATPLGIAAILVLAGAAGLLIFHSRSLRTVAIVSVVVCLAVLPVAWSASSWPALATSRDLPDPTSLADIAVYFFKVGAFTVGGGLTMIAFIQNQAVGQFGWLTPQEFIDGLALGQLTPGPILMLAAYVGYKVAGLAGAAVAAGAAFLPSFVLMLAVLPVLERVRTLTWTRAVMRGMAPAVVGILAVSLLRLAPHALPDLFAVGILMVSLVAAIVCRLGTVRLMIAGSILGALRTHLRVVRAFTP
jgi:chromate transporter